jgi:hypothetical protein
MTDSSAGAARAAESAAAGSSDEELLRRAELALTQLNNRHGLDADQAATLTAIRLRLEGKARASLEELLDAGKDLADSDPLAEAMRRRTTPSFEDALRKAGQKRNPKLEDLL